MPTKHARSDLQAKFAAGSIPTFEDFADIFASSLNQLEDEIHKSADEGLKLRIPSESAAGAPREVLLLYEDFAVDPLWKVQVRDQGLEIGRGSEAGPDMVIHTDGKVEMNQLTIKGDTVIDSNGGFSVFGADGNTSRLQVEVGGNIGIGTSNPQANLEIAGGTLMRGKVGIGGDINEAASLSVSGKMLLINTYGPPEKGTDGWGGNGQLLAFDSGTDIPLGIGMELNTLWRAVDTGGFHDWYVGTDRKMRLGAEGLVVDGKVSLGPGHTNTGSNAIVAGIGNTALGNTTTISGGSGNTIDQTNTNPGTTFSVIAGGTNNYIDQAQRATISGGNTNSINAGAPPNSASSATISGGIQNEILGNCQSATIGGGNEHKISGTPNLPATGAIIAGGTNNQITNSRGGAIGGGVNNVVTGNYATVPGGLDNVVEGQYAFAAGRGAKANHNGSFVWADSNNADVTSTANNQFLIYAAGGVGIGINDPSEKLEVNGNIKAAEFHGRFFNEAGEELANGGSSPSPWTINGNHVYRTSGRVGIGIASPSAELAVAGQINATRLSLFPDTPLRGKLELNLIKFGSDGDYQVLHKAPGEFGRNTLTMHVDRDDAFGVGSSNGENLMEVEGHTGNTFIKGNVGIGKKASSEKLEVDGKVKATEFHGRFFQENGDEVTRGEASPWAISGSNIHRTIGNVSIGGTDTSMAKLQVDGFVTSQPTANRRNYSAYFSDHIVSEGHHDHSDARIKEVIGVSNIEQDLRTLMNIEITDYKMKAPKRDQSLHKKVIGQQLEEVFPQAVSHITNAIPDILQKVEVKEGWVLLSEKLEIGERVKLLYGELSEVFEVKEVNGQGFRVDLPADITQVFVYGREVNDFTLVDYTAISMLNVSATKALFQEIHTLKQRLAQLEQGAYA